MTWRARRQCAVNSLTMTGLRQAGRGRVALSLVDGARPHQAPRGSARPGMAARRAQRGAKGGQEVLDPDRRRAPRRAGHRMLIELPLECHVADMVVLAEGSGRRACTAHRPARGRGGREDLEDRPGPGGIRSKALHAEGRASTCVPAGLWLRGNVPVVLNLLVGDSWTR